MGEPNRWEKLMRLNSSWMQTRVGHLDARKGKRRRPTTGGALTQPRDVVSLLTTHYHSLRLEKRKRRLGYCFSFPVSFSGSLTNQLETKTKEQRVAREWKQPSRRHPVISTLLCRATGQSRKSATLFSEQPTEKVKRGKRDASSLTCGMNWSF